MNTAADANLNRKPHALLSRGIHLIYAACIKPRAASEDDRHHELVLNVLLAGSFAVFAALTASILVPALMRPETYDGIRVEAMLGMTAFFAGLLALSRRGRHRASAYILLGAYYLFATYCAVRWGIQLAPAVVAYVFIIAAASVLLGTGFGLAAASVSIVTLIAVNIAHFYAFLPEDTSWRYEQTTLMDPVQIAIMLLLIAAISWLANRQMEKSLARARASERALIRERDSLEERIEARTAELKRLQEEKLADMARAAEFGDLSTGLFHDLMGPLSSVVASVSRLDETLGELPETKRYLEKAVSASRRIGEHLGRIRRQIGSDGALERFSAGKEIREAIDVLQYRARAAGVSIRFDEKDPIVLHGQPLHFYRVALNIIANAIDACREAPPGSRAVTAVLMKKRSMAVFKVIDRGIGIPDEMLGRIFDPYVTTKASGGGTGLGLSTAKTIIERSFGGTIRAKSASGKGSAFTVMIPLDHTIDELPDQAAD